MILINHIIVSYDQNISLIFYVNYQNYQKSMLWTSSDTKRTYWDIYSCLQIPPRVNWFPYIRRVYAAAINVPCITFLGQLLFSPPRFYPWRDNQGFMRQRRIKPSCINFRNINNMIDGAILFRNYIPLIGSIFFQSLWHIL